MSDERKKREDIFLHGVLANINSRLYESADVIKVLKKTDNKINHNLLARWVARGHVEPTERATGTGTRNLFNEVAICQIALFIELNRAGFNRSDSKRLAFQTETAHYFMSALGMIRNEARRLGGKFPNVMLDSLDRVWMLAAFSYKEDGSIETDYIFTKEEVIELYHNTRNYRLTLMLNLTNIADRVYMGLSD